MVDLRGEYAKVGDWRRTANGDGKSKKNRKREKKLKIPAIKNFRNTSSPRVPLPTYFSRISTAFVERRPLHER